MPSSSPPAPSGPPHPAPPARAQPTPPERGRVRGRALQPPWGSPFPRPSSPHRRPPRPSLPMNRHPLTNPGGNPQPPEPPDRRSGALDVANPTQDPERPAPVPPTCVWAPRPATPRTRPAAPARPPDNGPTPRQPTENPAPPNPTDAPVFRHSIPTRSRVDRFGGAAHLPPRRGLPWVAAYRRAGLLVVVIAPATAPSRSAR